MNVAPIRLALAAALAASAARATSITNEIGVNTTQSSDTNPRSGSVSDTLAGTIDITDQWTLDLGATLTLQGETPAAESGGFGTSGSAVSMFMIGLDWDISDHVTLGLLGRYSPPSTQDAGTSIALATGDVDALVESRTSEHGAGFDLSYDTAGDSDFEWAVMGGVSVNSLDTHQRVTEARTATGRVLTAAEIQAACAARTAACRPRLLATLKDQPFTLDSERLTAAATVTAFRDTDVGLGGDYYLYTQDPTQLGYFSVAAAGRTAVLGGNGVPIAPLHWLMRPEVTHRFGDFSARLWLQFGRYAPGTGQNTSGAGLRLQYKFTRNFRLWLTATGQRDTDDAGYVTKSGGLALGTGWRF